MTSAPVIALRRVICGVLMLAAFSLALILSVSFYLSLRESRFSGQVATIQAACVPIVAYLEEYHAHTGGYPPSLPDEYVVVIEALPKAGRYNVHDRGESCSLAFGNYFLDGFVLYWSGSVKSWCVDH